MKKLLATIIGVFTIMVNNEIVTLLVIAVALLIFAIFVLRAWAKTEKKGLDGSFSSDWGKK